MNYQNKKIKKLIIFLFLFFFLTLLSEESNLSNEVGQIVKGFSLELKDKRIEKIYITDFLEETTEKIYPDMNNKLKKLFENKLTDYSFVIVEKLIKTDGILIGTFLKLRNNLRVSVRVEDINGELIIQTHRSLPLTDEVRRMLGGSGMGEKVGFISISTNKDPCDIFIKNTKIGQTGTGKLSYRTGGPYNIKIKKPGYKPFIIQEIYIKENETYVRTDIELIPVIHKGSITINSDPPNAEIFLNGVTTNKKTPYTLKNIHLGEHIISVRKEGFKNTEKPCTLRYDGEHKNMLIAMEQIKAKEVGRKPYKNNHIVEKSPVDYYNKAFLFSCLCPGLGSLYLNNKGDERFENWWVGTLAGGGLVAAGILYNTPITVTDTNENTGETTKIERSPWLVKIPCLLLGGFFWYLDLSSIKRAQKNPRIFSRNTGKEGISISMNFHEIRIKYYTNF